MVISSCIHLEKKKLRKEEEGAWESGEKIPTIAEEEKRYGGGGEGEEATKMVLKAHIIWPLKCSLKSCPKSRSLCWDTNISRSSPHSTNKSTCFKQEIIEAPLQPLGSLFIPRPGVTLNYCTIDCTSQ